MVSFITQKGIDINMFDYHTHTNFSDDSTAPMEDMVRSAIRKGIKEIAITDHFDPDYPDETMPFDQDFASCRKEMERVKRIYANDITVIKGIEVGIQDGNTAQICSNIATEYDYDFIIGSFHSACGATLDQPEFHRERDSIKATVDYYEYVYKCIQEYNDYDVLGHINVIDRYVDEIPPKRYYSDQVETILKHLVENGKGLEINTSSFRYGLGDRTTPPIDILRLYVELGGEIITTGSDAHRPEDVGYMLEFSQRMIQKAGHNHVATFHGRKLIQHKL